MVKNFRYEPFSIEKVLDKKLHVVTRCGFEIRHLEIDTNGVPELPVIALVVEETTKGRGKNRTTKAECVLSMYHADGRIYEDKDDPFDLVIVKED